MKALHGDCVENKDVDKTPWFENCAIAEVRTNGKNYAVGMELQYIDNKLVKDSALIVNDVLSYLSHFSPKKG